MELEHCFVRCPWESLNLTFRAGQKLIDKEMGDAFKAIKGLASD
jgi:hypothetical protein